MGRVIPVNRTLGYVGSEAAKAGKQRRYRQEGGGYETIETPVDRGFYLLCVGVGALERVGACDVVRGERQENRLPGGRLRFHDGCVSICDHGAQAVA